MKKPPLIEVEWLDATTNNDQLSFKTARESCHLDHRFSVGYIVRKTREDLLICHTFDPAEYNDNHEDGGADFTTIPRGWVKSTTVLVPETGPATTIEEDI